MIAALETEGLCKNFDAFEVTRSVNFRLPRGARHALIGPNGAGKTTLIDLITGLLAPTQGAVKLNGADVTALTAEQRVWRGLSRTFQINTLFASFTPLEAVTLAVCQRRGIGAKVSRRLARCSAEIDEAFELLQRLHLADETDRPARAMAYGRQRLLEIALALAARPKVLLLDEPAAGIPAQESAELYAAIAALPSDIAVLFIEHDMDLVFRFAERITVLVNGQILCEGTPGEIAAHPEVRSVYLGEADHV